MENIIVFIGYSHQLPIVLGMFGKDNLEYLSDFDAKNFFDTNKQIYYHKGINSKIYLYNHSNDFFKESDEFFKEFKNSIFFVEDLDNCGLMSDRVELLKTFNPNIKKLFIWHYAEVFENRFVKMIKDIKYDFILSGSKRPELDTESNFYFDLLFPFRYFRYYIGYFYLEDLVKVIPLPKYDKSKTKLFSYIRAYQNNGWRTTILDNTPSIRKMLNPKNSANDAYDLVYPKHKHFETIYDYLYCNYNLIFETLTYTNNSERFITEKTFKGLFFGKPILLVACYETLNELRDMGFYLLNFDFVETIYSARDVEQSITLFTEWLDKASDDEIEEKYNQSLEKSIQNRYKLMDYLNDYSQMENLFKKLLLNQT